MAAHFLSEIIIIVCSIHSVVYHIKLCKACELSLSHPPTLKGHDNSYCCILLVPVNEDHVTSHIELSL